MTHVASKYWIGQVVYLKIDDDPGTITGVLFEGDPTHPTTKYRIAWANLMTTEHFECEIATDKNFK